MALGRRRDRRHNGIVRPRNPSRALAGESPDAQAIDALYGLEPVFEPHSDSSGLMQFVTVQCPYCGESFETAVDLSAGSSRYVEDCQVCCQPIELAVEVDGDVRLAAVTAGRG